MTDKNKHNEEYQFPNDEFMDSFHAESEPERPEVAEKPLLLEEQPAAPGGLSAVWEKHKRIMIVIGVLVVVTVVFAVMRTVKKPAPAPVTPTPVVQPAPAPTPIIDPQVMDQLTGLKQDADNNATVIRQLQGQVQELTTVLNQTRTEQQQLNQSVIALSTQVQELTAEVKVLTHPKPVKIVKPAPAPVPLPVITYQLRAVVPGRAWVVGSDGQSHSVAVGDQIPQYGNVQSIDADAGVVITTSGKTIKF